MIFSGFLALMRVDEDSLIAIAGREVDLDLFAAIVVLLLPVSFALERLVAVTLDGELFDYNFLLPFY